MRERSEACYFEPGSFACLRRRSTLSGVMIVGLFATRNAMRSCALRPLTSKKSSQKGIQGRQPASVRRSSLS
jgi:hypothetical protein